MKQLLLNTFNEKMKGIVPLELEAKLLLLLEQSIESVENGIKLTSERSNKSLLDLFVQSKKVEGCSEKTIKYYVYILDSLIRNDKHITSYDSDALRDYLSKYQRKNNASKVSVDNVRRVLSSFFNWLENENYIVKSPCRRISKIKTIKTIKEIYSDETIELLRNGCNNIRDLAIIDLLTSSGIRVGELVNLNISDVDLENRECVVFGKGGKERKVYFDSKAKLHLQNYLKSRVDDNEALFVSLLYPNKRLQISGIEILLRKIGKKMNISKVHPHRFRRTLATSAIDKGMPIEQVQKLLGHSKIDTTMLYAMVDQNNVKASYRKFLG